MALLALLAASAQAAVTQAAAPLGDAKGVEQPGLRTRISRTYLNPDGSYQAIISPGSVNYRDALGQWQPIDTNLVPSGDGFGVGADSYGLSLPKTAGAPVKVSVNGSFVSLALVGADAPAAVSGNAATYANARPATDLTYQATPDSVKETITLRDKTAPGVQTYRIASSSDLTASMTGRELRFTDRSGAVRFSVPAPFLEDAAGARTDNVSVNLTSDAQGQLLTITPDATWLAAPERKFPVIIDPSITPGPSTDCSLISGSSASTSFCSDPSLKVGYDGTKTYRAILKFDVSAIPAQSVVLGASVLMNTTSGTTSATTNTAADNLTRAFTSSATWNTYNGSSSWTTAGGDFDSTGEFQAGVANNTGWKNWYITQLAQNWVDGTTTNNGVIIRPTGTINQVISFASSENGTTSIRPYLSVSYQPWLGTRTIHTYEARRLSDRFGLQINVANGNLEADYADLHVAGTGLPLDIAHHFNSLSPVFGAPHGNKWQVEPSDQVKLYFFGNAVDYRGPGGFKAPFIPDGSGGYITPTGINATLVKNGTGTYTLTFDHSGIKYQYDSSGNLTRMEDRNGNHIDVAYNGSGRTSTVTDTQGRAVTYAYNGSGYLSSITDSTGRQLVYGYNGANHLTSITDAAGKQYLMEYTDPSNSLTKVTDPLGNVTKMTYDSTGRVLTITRVTNPSLGTGPVTTYSYTAVTTGCPSGTVGATSSTDPNSHVTRYCYDRQGRVLGTFDGNGHLDQATLTANSDPAVQTAPAGDVTTDTYNTNNELTNVAYPEGSSESSTYADSAHPDLPTTVTDGSGHTTSYVYTAAGNPCSVSSDATPPASCTATGTNQTKLSYNADGTLASSTDPNGNVTTYGYTGGNLTSVTHPSPLGAESFGYDALSRMTSHTDGKGQTTTYAYDPLDRLTTITYQGGATITYTYDAAGNRTSRVDNTGTTTYGYDALNRLTSESLPGGRTNTYGLDGVGNLTSLTDAGGTVSYGYDAADNPTSVTEPGSIQTTLAYDADNRLTTTTLPTSTGVVITRTWEGSHLTRIRATQGSTVLTDFRYCYRIPASGCAATPQTGMTTDQLSRNEDLAGGNTIDYSYDPVGRLTRAQTSGTNPSDFQYAYDAAGNRSSQTVDGGTPTTYSYNAANQMTAAGAVTFSYDANGNLTGNSSGLSLTYNAKNQTTSVTPPGGSTTAMVYAGEGQADRTQAGATNFTTNVLGIGYETTGGSTTYYTRTPTGELLGQRQPTGRRYPLTDGIGSVAKVVDDLGAVVNTYRYDPFGSVAATSGSSSNSNKFAGEYQDPSGLYKIGERYFDPNRGVWTQEDPIVQLNAYATYSYANSDPVNLTDPSGLCLYYFCQNPVTTVKNLLRPVAHIVYRTVVQYIPQVVCSVAVHVILKRVGGQWIRVGIATTSCEVTVTLVQEYRREVQYY